MEIQLIVESGAREVEFIVIPVDIAQIACRPHHVVPGAPFAGKQAGNVFERAPHLSSQISDVSGFAVLIVGKRSGDK
jgi:hypothetical protein